MADTKKEETNAELLAALKDMVGLIDALYPKVPWGQCWLAAEDIQKLNEAPPRARRAIHQAEGQDNGREQGNRTAVDRVPRP